MVKIKVGVTRNEAAVKKLLANYGKGSQLQKIIDMEVHKRSMPYTPKDSGDLNNSPVTNQHKAPFGLGRLLYTIYGNPNGKNSWNDTTSKFQDGMHAGGLRGPFWVIRMWNNGGREAIIKIANNFIKKFRKQ